MAAIPIRTLAIRALPVSLAAAGTLHAQTTDYAALQATMGEPVTSSVIGKPQRASDVPADVTIITREQIAAAPARDVPGLLQRYAGVDVTRFTAGQAEVAIRGGVQPYNSRLLVLVDGRQVYLDHYGMTNWNLLGIQMEDIQQIEIVRGPASALFGFNAATGVINIVTLDGFSGRAATVRADLGNRRTRDVRAVVAQPVTPSVSIRMSAGSMRQNERRVPESILTSGPSKPVSRDDVSGTLTGILGATTRAVVGGGIAWNAQQEFTSDFPVISRQRFRTRHFSSEIRHDTPWGGIDARSYTNDLRTASDSAATYRQRVFVSQANAVVRLGGGNNMRVGGEYRDNRQLSSGVMPGASYRLFAATGMVDLHPVRGIALSLAGRADRLLPGATEIIAEEGPVVATAPPLNAISFNAGLVAELGARDQLRLNGGRGLQLPSLIELNLVTSADAFGYGIHPNAAWSVEGGYRHVFGDALTLNAGTYWSRNHQSYAFILRDVGSYTSTGGALSLSGTIGAGLSWRTNYSLTIVKPVGDQALAEQIARTPWRTTPRHKANVAMDYARGRWTGGVAARYTSTTTQPRLDELATVRVRVPEAIALDAALRVRLTSHVFLHAQGENLTQARGAGGGLIPSDRRVRIGLGTAL